MARNVFIASLAFFIPLHRLRRRYRRLRGSRKEIALPFAHYPNAHCAYRLLSDVHSDPLTREHTFSFRSRHDGKDEEWCQVGVRPFLVEFRLRRRRFHMLLLLASVNKVFPGAAEPYRAEDFCTEFDLVSLKKAFLEKGKNGLHAGRGTQSPDFHEWLTDLLHETAGKSYRYRRPVYSIADVRVQQLEVTPKNNYQKRTDAAFQEAFYHSSDSSVDAFLHRPVRMPADAGSPDHIRRTHVTEADFVHGLLYANDNFMMLAETAKAAITEGGHTNNRTEKFWADDGSIVRLSVHAPFFLPEKEVAQRLKGEPDDAQCLPEMCLLIYLRSLLSKLKREHRSLSADEIDERLGELDACLREPLFNLTETDRRMDYFKERFGLPADAAAVKSLMLPRKNLLERFFQRTTGKIAIFIAALAWLTDILCNLLDD